MWLSGEKKMSRMTRLSNRMLYWRHLWRWESRLGYRSNRLQSPVLNIMSCRWLWNIPVEMAHGQAEHRKLCTESGNSSDKVGRRLDSTNMANYGSLWGVERRGQVAPELQSIPGQVKWMLMPQGSQEQAFTGEKISIQFEMLVGCLDGNTQMETLKWRCPEDG